MKKPSLCAAGAVPALAIDLYKGTLFLSYTSSGTWAPCHMVIGPSLRSPRSSNCRTALAALGTLNVTEMQLNGERANGAGRRSLEHRPL